MVRDICESCLRSGCDCDQPIWTFDMESRNGGRTSACPRERVEAQRSLDYATQHLADYRNGPIRRVTDPAHAFPANCERCKQFHCICPKAVATRPEIRTDIVVTGADPNRVARMIREQLMAAAGVIALEPREEVKMVEVPAKASEVVLGGMLTQAQLARAIFDHGLNAEAAKLAEVPSLKALRRILDIMWGTPDKPGTKSERRRECWALATAYLVAARQREEAGKP